MPQRKSHKPLSAAQQSLEGSTMKALGPARLSKGPSSPASSWIRAPIILFDVEGTLVDAVPLTLRCWKETLAEFGHDMGLQTLQRLSGMDGRDMLAHLFPELTDDAAGRILESQGKRYRAQYLPQVRP